MKLPATHYWRWIVVNSSGGKDSQTALRQVVAACDAAGVDRTQIVVSHQCLGEMEWPGVYELVLKHAAAYGLRVEVSRYRDRFGNHPTLLDYVARRGMWPSSKQRYCTSDFKRAPGGRVLVKLFREAPGPILNVYGFRADESPSRAKRKPLAMNVRYTTRQRPVWDWLPIHDWSEQAVWEDIRESGLPHHPAYDLCMPRLSCRFCIFAPRAALIIAGRANPELLDAYCDVERKIGHTFRQDLSLAQIREAVRAGEQPSQVDGPWKM